jgi:hypothetical protein
MQRVVSLGNHKGMTDGMIMVGQQKRQSLMLIIDIDGIGIQG